MKINYATQSSFEEISAMQFDILIAASGYETRARFFFESFLKVNNRTEPRICLSFTDTIAFSKKANDTFFRENGFEFIEVGEQSLNDLIAIFENLFGQFKAKSLSILIDYSCMTKTLYAGILKYFTLQDSADDIVELYFNYTQAEYSLSSNIPGNLNNQPIPLFPSVELTDKKIALIISLGYQEGKAQGLIEYLQVASSDIYLFYTSKYHNVEFHEALIVSNKYLLSKISETNHFQYDIENTSQVMNLMESLTNYLLSKEYRVIVAPVGPKVFSLISILLAVKYNRITILRVSDGNATDPVDKIPNKQKGFVIIRALFQNYNIPSAKEET